MKCPLCNKEIDFYNVDWEGIEYCPECGGAPVTDNNIVRTHEIMRKRAYLKQIERYGEEL